MVFYYEFSCSKLNNHSSVFLLSGFLRVAFLTRFSTGEVGRSSIKALPISVSSSTGEQSVFKEICSSLLSNSKERLLDGGIPLHSGSPLLSSWEVFSYSSSSSGSGVKRWTTLRSRMLAGKWTVWPFACGEKKSFV